jgi:hypothetical protein
MSVTQASLLGDTFGSKASGTIPVGGIIMWSGSIGTIPTGWALCNGSNGTPNLQDRFIVGAGSGYSVAGTGGSADATLVSHSHTGTTDTGGVHSHGYNAGGVVGSGWASSNKNGPAAQTTTTHNGHEHTFDTSTTGSPATNANLPPYYALAFIMRTS